MSQPSPWKALRTPSAVVVAGLLVVGGTGTKVDQRIGWQREIVLRRDETAIDVGDAQIGRQAA